MAPEMAKELKALQQENTRLKKLVADQALDNAILKEAAKGNFCAPSDVASLLLRCVAGWGLKQSPSVKLVVCWVNHARRSVTSRRDQGTSGSSWPRCEASPIVVQGTAVPACIARCKLPVGTSITSESSESGGKKACKSQENSTVADGCPIVAARIAASVDVPSTKITSGRTTSSPIEPKIDDRFGSW